MREVISNTSPLQYLFQAELLDLLPALYGTIVVPGGVAAELAEGRVRGMALPDPTLLPWAHVRVMPNTALLQLAADLDRGEREVIAIAKQAADPLAILDDGLARRHARLLGFPSRDTGRSPEGKIRRPSRAGVAGAGSTGVLAIPVRPRDARCGVEARERIAGMRSSMTSGCGPS